MNKEKALKNQGLEFREDIIMTGRIIITVRQLENMLKSII